MKRSSLTGILSLPAAMFLLGLGTACSSDSTNLRLQSLDQQRGYQQSFTQAYVSRDLNGDTNIALIADHINSNSGDPKKPLSPDAHVFPLQLVHIRVFWTPQNGTKADHPANTNASIRWCFLGQGQASEDMVVYSGSGLVIVRDSANSASITIRKAWMKPTFRRGNMIDPLGASMLDGKIYAVRDPDQVRAVLAQLKAVAPTTAVVQSTPADVARPADLVGKP